VRAAETLLRSATVLISETHKRQTKPQFKTQCYQTRRKTPEALHTARTSISQKELQTYAALRKLYQALAN